MRVNIVNLPISIGVNSTRQIPFLMLTTFARSVRRDGAVDIQD